MDEDTRRRIKKLLDSLYGSQFGDQISQSVFDRVDQFKTRNKKSLPFNRELFNQQDVVLITYGNMVQNEQCAPLQSLLDFYQSYLQSTINTIHILPFFPYSSDDGFSVIDYKAVNPALGNWQDITALKKAGIRLMFDAVINHISSQSDWFKNFLNGDEQFADYFITVDPKVDLSQVTRPRSLPLLTAFETKHGLKHVWTTFSSDQIDLNFAHPETLLDVLDFIIFYIEQGADLTRLDAIAYLWKEIGTTCIHLPQTHAFVKLLRLIVDDISPGHLLITETNVPHEENISYFGNGKDEAHLVYQFSLPPLIAHAIISGSAFFLRKWASTLEFPSEQTCFFNFTASHDGVGVRPVTGILPDEELNLLLKQTISHGGKISSKANPDGSTSPYELNINYFDLLNDPKTDVTQTIQIDRFLASQAIMLTFKGIPGIYFHSLVGSRNYYKGVEEHGHARAINREKLDAPTLKQELNTPGSLRNVVFMRYRFLLELRVNEKAFHPAGEQRVVNTGDAVFAVLRTSPDCMEQILALQNLSSQPQTIALNLGEIGLKRDTNWLDLITSKKFHFPNSIMSIALSPYQTMWLKSGGG